MTYLRSSKGNKAPLKASKGPLKATTSSLTKPIAKEELGNGYGMHLWWAKMTKASLCLDWPYLKRLLIKLTIRRLIVAL